MSRFRPPLPLRGGNRQTLLAHFARRRGALRYRRERWDTPDGDFLDIDFAEVPGATWSDLGPAAPVGLVIHGLGGSSESGYVWDCCRELAANGLRPVVMNCRGSGGEPNRGDRLYHAGDHEDPGFVVEQLAARFEVPLGVVGYSLGGGMMLNYLGRTGGGVPDRLAAAVSVSSPLDLARCADRIEQGFSNVYNRKILRGLIDLLKQRGEVAGFDLGPAYRARTIREFDEALIAPLHGFGGAGEYYLKSSPLQVLGAIRVPTLLLRALDDPFLDPVDIEAVVPHDHLELCVHPTGGHVGFVRWGRSGPVFWGEKRAAGWLAERLHGG